MGQTLTHGIYLPDEGERNCYNGLAANWQLLDNSVGTIAEHTSALAGKAPLVHTHTKSDITDFPAYGNTAGTICEGNDSRLSDARTPVAHTHTKSDVTDLLNSNFIPSANNSYNLGSSSYQWNNLYAKNYYYNGVAWGLDKSNTWRDVNKFTSIIQLQYLQSGGYSDIRFLNENDVNECTIRHYTGTFTIGKKYQSASVWWAGSQIILDNNGTVQIKSYDGTENWTVNFTPVGVYPISNNALELGTSTNKWKTLNGVNPGALSLPDLSVSQNVDTTGWVYNGTTLNSVLLNTSDTVVTKNGWLYIRTNSTVAGDRVAVRLYNVTAEDPTAIAGEIGFGHIEIFVPIVAGYKAYVFTNKAPTYIKFYPCLGNVPSGV